MCDLSDERFEDLIVVWEKASKPLLKPRDKAELIYQYIHSHPRNATNLFCLCRLLLPALDRGRGVYGLREVSLSRLYADAFVLPPTEAKRLRYYRDPSRVAVHTKATRSSATTVGDFPSVLLAVLEDRLSDNDKHRLTLGQVNAFLTDLCQAQDMPQKVDLFRERLAVASPLQHKWICRIILKDLKLGIGHERILRMFTPTLADAYNVLGDLEETITKFEAEFKDKGPDWDLTTFGSPSLPDSLGAAVIRPFRPIKPMLAKRLHLKDAERFLSDAIAEGATYSMEPKLDGERLLCHLVRQCTDDITETKVVFFSRRGDSEYPSAYIPHFTDVLEKSIQVDEVILDGELLVWNRLTEALLPFGSARSAGAGKIDNADLFYVVFDVLHVKSHGQSHDVLALPLLKRRELLKRVITYEEPHHLEIVKSTEITKPEEIHEALEKVVIERGEGIMLKREDSQYMLGSRDAGWYKMKPEFGWLDDSLDLVVVGCFLSDGVRRRAHHSADPIDHISTFLLGILSDDKESILTFTKVGTGYTFEELREMVDMLRPYLMPLEAKDPLPEWTPNWTPNVSTRPDFILDHFSHGFVMEVIGAEIVESDVFGYGKTLRFPRAARGGAIRRDKDWADAETLTTIQALLSGTSTRTSKRKRGGDGSDAEYSSPRRQARKTAAPSIRSRPDLYLDIGGSYNDALYDDSTKIENPFLEKQYVLVLPFSILKESKMPTPVFKDKPTLEKVLEAAGAKIIQTFKAGLTDLVIADQPSVRSKHFNQQFNITIYNHLYVADCVRASRLLDAEPKYVVHPNRKLQNEWSLMIDEFGDWFTKPFQSLEDLKDLLDRMDPIDDTLELDECQILQGYQDDDDIEAPIEEGSCGTKLAIAVWMDNEFVSLAEDAVSGLLNTTEQAVDFDLFCSTGQVEPAQPPSMAHLILPAGLKTALMKFTRISVASAKFLVTVRRLLFSPLTSLVTLEELENPPSPSPYKWQCLLMVPNSSGDVEGDNIQKSIEELSHNNPHAQLIVMT